MCYTILSASNLLLISWALWSICVQVLVPFCNNQYSMLSVLMNIVSSSEWYLLFLISYIHHIYFKSILRASAIFHVPQFGLTGQCSFTIKFWSYWYGWQTFSDWMNIQQIHVCKMYTDTRPAKRRRTVRLSCHVWGPISVTSMTWCNCKLKNGQQWHKSGFPCIVRSIFEILSTHW